MFPDFDENSVFTEPGRAKIHDPGGYGGVLCNYKAVSIERCDVTAYGVLMHQGIEYFGSRCDYSDFFIDQRHDWQGGFIPSGCYKSSVQYY